jgi:hypothetical protein
MTDVPPLHKDSTKDEGPVRPKLPTRIAERPRPEDWDDDELLTLAEAASLFWPRGPLTASSLRTAYRNGELAVVQIARKLFTTKDSIREMTGPKRKSES